MTDLCLLNLDYDRVSYDFVLEEFFGLYTRFKVPLVLCESSKDSYHIRCPKLLDREQAFRILNRSRCSFDYKRYCARMGCCPIRDGAKDIYKGGELVESRPAPVALLKLGF